MNGTVRYDYEMQIELCMRLEFIAKRRGVSATTVMTDILQEYVDGQFPLMQEDFDKK